MYRRLTLVVAALALAAAACGNDGTGDDVASLSDVVVDDTAAASGDDPPVDTEQAMLEFTQCMRDNGIDMDDPTVDAEGNLRLSRPRDVGAGARADRETVQAAREACSGLLEGVALGFREIDRTEIEDTLVEFAACMRDNGYDMPDPDFSNAGPGAGGAFGRIDPDDPAFAAAGEQCDEILAGFGPGPGPGRGPGAGGGDG